MLEISSNVLILGSLVAVIGGSMGLFLVRKWGSSMSNRVFNDRLDLLQDENRELKKYLKANKGALGQLKEGLTIPDDSVLEEGNFNGIITGLIGKYQNLCPPQFRFLLSDPAIVSFLLEEAKKHPEQTKEVLKHFMGKNSIGKESSGDESKQQLETITEGGA